MAESKKAARPYEGGQGRDVLYVMSDGITIRPAKIVTIDPESGRATLAIFTAGIVDRGLIEHQERSHVEASGLEPAVLTRADVEHQEDQVEPGHDFEPNRAGKCKTCDRWGEDVEGNPTHPTPSKRQPHTWFSAFARGYGAASSRAPTEPAPPEA